MFLRESTPGLTGAILPGGEYMLVLVANQTNRLWHYWAGRYGNLGQLFSPGAFRKPAPWLPYALDNGAYGCYLHGLPFNGDAYYRLLDKAASYEQPPMWALVPDVVADRDATLRQWEHWAPTVRQYRWPLAFAVQDGMTTDDVPGDASVVFVGGSTEWKLRTMQMWCQTFGRVHIARVNTWPRLWAAHDFGAESIDGTGWYHDRQAAHLEEYLCHKAGKTRRPQRAGMQLFHEPA